MGSTRPGSFDNSNDVRIYGPTNWAVDSLLVTNASVRFAESQFALTVTNTLTIGHLEWPGAADRTRTLILMAYLPFTSLANTI